MRAGQVMTADILSISSGATVFDAAELLIATGVSAMPVIDDANRMVGIVSEADLMRRAEIGTEPHKSWFERILSGDSTSAAEYVSFHSRRVTDVMTRKVVTVAEDDTLAHVAEVMARHKVKRVPVCRGAEVIGVVSRADLLKAFMSREPGQAAARVPDEQIRRDVESTAARQPWVSPWPVNIVVNAGVVHLWGFVQSDETKEAYRVAAENVAGVAKVKNHLRRMPAAVGMGV